MGCSKCKVDGDPHPDRPAGPRRRAAARQPRGAPSRLVFVRGQRFGFEFKYADAPTVTRSLRVAREDLKLVRVFVVHPGQKSYPLEEWAEAVALPHLRDRLLKLVSPRK